MTSAAAGPDPPLYGTWLIFTPAFSANSSITSRFKLPLPCEAKLTFPGRSLR